MRTEPSASTRDVIVIGVSAGGVEALRVIAAGLPGDLPAAVLIVMHMSPQSPYLLPQILRTAGPLVVGDAQDGASIERAKIYVAPPDRHLLVKKNCISLMKGPKENRSRPAIDPLFRSAAVAYGPRVIGVILTGMLDDGTAGLAAVKARGGLAIVQDPKDALYPSMPTSALRYAGSDFTVPLLEIAPLLTRLVTEPAAAREHAPLSRLIEIESNFDKMEAMQMQDMDTIGSHAGLSCPECHGPIWRIKDGAQHRYRCHVGHAYTAAAMTEGQIEAQETYLWQALRLMKERQSLIWEMRSQAQDGQNDRSEDVARYDEKLGQLQKNISVIQDMLENGDS